MGFSREEYTEYHESEQELRRIEAELKNEGISGEFECPECEYVGTPIDGGRSKENTDADGNRGVWMRWAICPECGCEQGVVEY